MAYSVVETRIANPAGKRKRKMAKRHLTAKQIRAGFGGARRKAALKTRRANSAKKHHKRRTNPSASAPKKRHRLKVSRHRPRAKRKNPTPEIISFVMGNPAKRKGRKMAKHSYSKKRRQRNAGAHHYTKRRRRNTARTIHHRKRRNPGELGRPMDWVKGGVGVIAGGVGTRMIPQFFGSTNAGGIGYAMNAATAIILAWGAHAFTKDRVLTASVAAGGFAALILRIVGDLTPYGQALSLSGFGDYMVSNWVTPQRIVDPRQAMFEVPSGWGTMPMLGPAAVGQQSGADARTSGNSY